MDRLAMLNEILSQNPEDAFARYGLAMEYSNSGEVERGSVSSLRAVLWYADIRAFTRVSDASPGHVIVALLDEVFETMTAALRYRP